jgi:hypothetical protein
MVSYSSKILYTVLGISVTIALIIGSAFCAAQQRPRQEFLEKTKISKAEKAVLQGNNKGKNRVCKNQNNFEFRPGVIVDLDGHTAYLMNSQGGIDAINFSSGTLVWRSAKAAKPLFLCDKLLIAQGDSFDRGNILRIAALNTNDVDHPVFEAAIELPDKVLTSIVDGLGTSFHVSTHTYMNDLLVSWKFYRQIITGVAPDKDSKIFDYEAVGDVRIDLKTGHVDSLGPDEKPPLYEPRLPEKLQRLIDQGLVPSSLCRAGNILAAIKRVNDKGESRVTLMRWGGETGETLPEVPLFGPEFTFRYFSADCRHVLASRVIKSDNVAETAYLWSIYSVETGTFVTEVRNPMPAAWFFIWQSCLIHETRPYERFVDGKWIQEPLKLQAIDFKTGHRGWEWPFRNTSYQGSYPPKSPPGLPVAPTPTLP